MDTLLFLTYLNFIVIELCKNRTWKMLIPINMDVIHQKCISFLCSFKKKTTLK